MSLEERSRRFDGDLLRGEYDISWLEKTGLLGRTYLRKMRYWCYKYHHAAVEGLPEPNAPEGLKEFVEKLPGFAGWKKFAISWDIHGENPFMIVLRLMSVWEEWDIVMKRVSIPLDASPDEINARIQVLTDEFARKEGKRK